MIETERSSGREARHLLQRIVRGEGGFAAHGFEEPLYQRVADAVELVHRRAPSEARPTPLDLAVLLRQVLRFEEAHPDETPQGVGTPSYQVPAGPGWPTSETWAQAGVVADPGPNATFRLLRARPWTPLWLGGDVDGAAAGRPRRLFPQEVPGDPFLTQVGAQGQTPGQLTHYRSPAQRAAIRSALSAAPGSTLVVCLPTGEGKSLVFQSVAAVGYGDARDTQPGVVVVVVPTTSLALDHERSLHRLGFERRPYAYVSGNEESRALIRERIADGTQGIVLASPESISRSLRWPLERAVEAGYLRALVLDEAHMVDQWGADFRPDFQVLSGVRRDWLARGTVGPQFRTILLSATFTETALRTVVQLFGGQDDAPVPGGVRVGLVAAARLRPEPSYWIAQECAPAERQDRVVEALRHLPRPLIVYSTRVEDAKYLFARLKSEGFGRVGLMHGGSTTVARDQLIDRWRRATVDVVVATSAFGLGIDNADVRTVVHACIPETLDRFYQEVGRAGRDGHASLSVLIPAYGDVRTAEKVNRRTLIAQELGLTRWEAMYASRVDLARLGVVPMQDAFAVRVDAPGGVAGDRFHMVGDLNASWHLQTLNLMAQAELLDLLAGPARPQTRDDDTYASGQSDQPGQPDERQYQLVRVRDPRLIPPNGPNARQAWDERVAAVRQRLGMADDASLNQMRAFAKAGVCASEILAPLYEVAAQPQLGLPAIQVSPSCGGCPTCRRKSRAAWSGSTPEPSPPWPARPLPPALADLLGSTRRLFVFYPPAELGVETARRATRRRVTDALQQLVRMGVHGIVPLGEMAVTPADLATDRLPLFVCPSLDIFDLDGLPRGPLLVLAGPNAFIPEDQLLPSFPEEDGRIFLLPDTHPDPRHISRLIRDVVRDRRLTLDHFITLYGGTS